MAYLHCHTKGCNWSQDDFWELKFRVHYYKWRESWWKYSFSIGYNPISRMWNDIAWLWKPRWMSLDKWIIDDITEYTGVKVKVREVKKKREHDPKSKIVEVGPDGKPLHITNPYYTEYQVFSWQWLKVEWVKNWRSFRHMEWWTWKSWKKARDNAVCPKCGERNFDID